MLASIDLILRELELRRISRREALAALSAIVAFAGKSAAAGESPFTATGINHVALRVTDIPHSRDFYSRLLGLETTSVSDSSCFLNMRSGFLTLFRGENPGLDHFCFAVENYDIERAEKLLTAQGLEPRRPRGTDRIYFNDPDGLELQLSSEQHKP